MKENYGDVVVQKVKERCYRAKDKLASDFKGVKPFQKEPVDKSELYESYNYYLKEAPDRFGYMQQLIDTYGYEAVNNFIFQMETLKDDKRRKLDGGI